MTTTTPGTATVLPLAAATVTTSPVARRPRLPAWPPMGSRCRPALSCRLPSSRGRWAESLEVPAAVAADLLSAARGGGRTIGGPFLRDE